MAKRKKVAKRKTLKRARPVKRVAKKIAKRKKVIGAKKAPRQKAPKRVRMPAKELKIYKALLIKEREKIGGDLSFIAKETLNRSQKDASGDLSGYSYHMADAASDNYDVEFSLGRATDEQKLLYGIDEALRRMEDGTYGTCLQCNKAIDRKRLRAIPHSPLCIECQKANEVK